VCKSHQRITIELKLSLRHLCDVIRSICLVVFVAKDFCFNPSASPFLPTAADRLTETPAMAAQLPYIQPSWSQAEFSPSNWSNVYHHEPTLPYQLYGNTAYYGTEEIDSRNASFDQPGSVSCPVDWYSDSTGNYQALQSLPSLQVIFFFCIVSILS